MLGGVYELKRTVKHSGDAIKEFLTDVPVAVTPQERYYITLKLRRTAAFPFDGAIHEVAVRGGGRAEVYAYCTVEQVESCVAARDEADYTVVIAARERSVADE